MLAVSLGGICPTFNCTFGGSVVSPGFERANVRRLSEPMAGARRGSWPCPALVVRRFGLVGFVGVVFGLVMPAASEHSATIRAAQRGSLAGVARIEGVVDYQLKPSRRRRADVQTTTLAPPTFSGRSKTVVYLQQGPRGAFESNESRAVLDQRNETFAPYVLPVQVGTIVHFPNNDDVFHNVFSLSPAKKFDLGRYARGDSKTVLFDKPGVVRLFCDIHSHMSAFVIVFSHRYFTTTDDAGRYSIEAVPAGRYTLVAWADGEIRASTQVDVLDGRTSRADFIVE